MTLLTLPRSTRNIGMRQRLHKNTKESCPPEERRVMIPTSNWYSTLPIRRTVLMQLAATGVTLVTCLWSGCTGRIGVTHPQPHGATNRRFAFRVYDVKSIRANPTTEIAITVDR